MKNLKTKRNLFIRDYLLENYSNKTKDEIIKDLKLSWNYIQKMCHLFGIKRGYCESKRSLIKLKDLKDNISCYWLGFLLADGHITKRYVFNVNISIKDKDHFQKIEEHIDIKLKPSYRVRTNSVRYTLTDRKTILEISKIFNWQTNKTKIPPTIPNLNKDQMFSLIVGFIDGDGSISKKDGSIRIKVDYTWSSIINSFYTHLTNDVKSFNTSDGCSVIYISRHSIVKFIKEKAISLNLPIMIRKWNRININRILKSEKRDIVRNLLLSNKSVKNISDSTGFSKSLIYSIKRNLSK